MKPCANERSNRLAALLCGLALKAGPAAATALADLSIEELGNIPITSVSKRQEPLSDAAASVFVITADDIRRAGATTLPQALRLAPNLQVAQANGVQYSISARGLNNLAGNKLLVLIDGRSVYTPTFSGVFWDAPDVMMEDVDRIEVISGPGSTLWGANAVNGVINVITRNAADTTGNLLSAQASRHSRDLAVRHGGSVGPLSTDGAQYRVYVKRLERDAGRLERGGPAQDGRRKSQAGFRIDSGPGGEAWTVQGDLYEGTQQQPRPGILALGTMVRPLNDVSISGMNLSGRWAHALDDGSELAALAYYDRTVRTVPGTLEDTWDALDLKIQHTLAPIGAHALVWGVNYRSSANSVANSDFAVFTPARVRQTLASVFAQDQIAWACCGQLTLGARWAHNAYTEAEFMPTARLAWRLSSKHLLWAAATRTVRTPSRIDRDMTLVGASDPRAGFNLTGGPSFVSEVAQVYEMGLRGQPSARLSYSLALYHADYQHLRSYQAELSAAPPVIRFVNELQGSTHGLELWATLQASRRWRLSGGLTTVHKDLSVTAGSSAPTPALASALAAASLRNAGNDPSWSWTVRSALALSDRWDLDLNLRRVGALPDPAVPAYVALDLRLAWRPGAATELSVGGRNVLGGAHAEFADADTRRAYGPEVYVNVLTRF